MMKQVCSLIFVLALAVAFAVPSHAAESGEPEGHGAGHGAACRDDMKKFCKDIKPGEGRMMECMKSHEAELSSGCKSMMASKKEHMKERMHSAHEACKPDVEKFCKDIEPGKGRIMECLKSHESELSAACKDVHSKMQSKMDQMKHMKKHD